MGNHLKNLNPETFPLIPHTEPAHLVTVWEHALKSTLSSSFQIQSYRYVTERSLHGQAGEVNTFSC